MLFQAQNIPTKRHAARGRIGLLLLLLSLTLYVQSNGKLAYCQELYGSIVGNVTDATGAVVPQAEVRATEVGTNDIRTTTTDAYGNYSLTSVRPGTYRIDVVKNGFQTFQAQNVAVAYNRVVRVNPVLTVGNTTQTVTVSAQTAVLQTDSAQVSTQISSLNLQNLPQPTRNFEGLIGLAEGSDMPYAGGNGTNDPARSMQFATNGTSPSSTDVRIEGISALNPWVQFYSTVSPSVEAIESVNVVKGASESDQTLVGGTSVNVQLKSGTNKFHGEVYEYHQDMSMKARPFFLSPSKSKPKDIDNDFGATLGGPILRNKLFFFGSWETDLERSSSVETATVPTADILNGDFSATGTQLYMPDSGDSTGANKVPFPNNNIANYISPIVKKLIPLIQDNAAPTVNGSFSNNFQGVLPTTYNLHKIDGKVDWNATKKLRLTGRTDIDPYKAIKIPIFGSTLGTGKQAGYPNYNQSGLMYAVTGAATYQASPTVVLDATWGFNRPIQRLIPIDDDVKYGSDTLGIPGVNLEPLPVGGGMPQFNISGYTSYGYAYAFLQYDDPVFQYAGNVNWLKGKHSIEFGTNISQQHMNHLEPGNDAFSFNGGATASNGAGAPNQFNAYADFLLGLPNSWQNEFQTFGAVTERTWEYSFYGKDTWQANRKLTLTYGTAWEYFPLPTHKTYGMSIYDPVIDTYEVCGLGIIPKNCGVTVQHTLFAPQLGVAYRPFPNTVIRAGASSSPEQINMARDTIYDYPENIGYSAGAFIPYGEVGSLSDGVPVNSPPDLRTGILPITSGMSIGTVPKHFVRGYVESFNLTLERSFGDWLAQVGYVGTRSIHGHTRYNFNYGTVGGGSTSQLWWPLHHNTNGQVMILPLEHMRYDSLQASLKKRMSNGLELSANYTLSDWRGLCCDPKGDSQPMIPIPQYFNLNYARMPDDMPQRLNFTAIAESPFGAGKPWVQSGVGAAVLGDWNLNLVFQAFSGTPFSVTANGASLNAPGSTQRADRVKKDAGVTGSIKGYFDPTAFAPVTTARFGTAAFDSVRGPGGAQLDGSLFRSFHIRENLLAQFRFEAYNVTNTPHFSNPASNVGSVQYDSSGNITNLHGFTQITSTSPRGRTVDERFLRLGMKIVF